MFRLDGVLVKTRMKLFSSSVRKTEPGMEFRECMRQCTRSPEMHYNCPHCKLFANVDFTRALVIKSNVSNVAVH